MEIERKYLVRQLPENLEGYPHVEIEQCYLCTSPTLRIRRMGDEYWLTVKERVASASDAIHNREEEFRLSRETYERLRAKCEGRPVLKTRYRILTSYHSSKGFLFAELDIFHGEHEGLMLFEVESPTTADADAFVPPKEFGEDVSTNPLYRNSTLAGLR